MSEYQDKHTVSRLIGSPPGYVGYDEGGQLTEQVKTKPYSVELFDEVEKAHKDIFSALLKILYDGYMTDSFGRKINFKNCLIIMTSNLGVKKMQEFGAGVGFSKTGNVYTNEELKKTMLNKELKNHFAPEFINRLDEVIVFNTLQNDDIQKIVLVEVNKLKSRLSKLGYNINFGQSVIDFVSKVGFDDVYTRVKIACALGPAPADDASVWRAKCLWFSLWGFAQALYLCFYLVKLAAK
jgi:ATP-dependent Clp protease ATP-binding subunit ClpC